VKIDFFHFQFWTLSLDSCHVSESFSASAKWLALGDDIRCSAACKLDDGNRLDAHAILA
jgi:hypothetical protein